MPLFIGERTTVGPTLVALEPRGQWRLSFSTRLQIMCKAWSPTCVGWRCCPPASAWLRRLGLPRRWALEHRGRWLVVLRFTVHLPRM